MVVGVKSTITIVRTPNTLWVTALCCDLATLMYMAIHVKTNYIGSIVHNWTSSFFWVELQLEAAFFEKCMSWIYTGVFFICSFAAFSLIHTRGSQYAFLLWRFCTALVSHNAICFNLTERRSNSIWMREFRTEGSLLWHLKRDMMKVKSLGKPCLTLWPRTLILSHWS